mmetsp:Transcript_30187/g.59097  ORF Transcript_30187/g.59097 Transcript_30187/m.59097 type:complete len:131 (+) Transcript_30187:93-485(+)
MNNITACVHREIIRQEQITKKAWNSKYLGVTDNYVNTFSSEESNPRHRSRVMTTDYVFASNGLPPPHWTKAEKRRQFQQFEKGQGREVPLTKMDRQRRLDWVPVCSYPLQQPHMIRPPAERTIMRGEPLD